MLRNRRDAYGTVAILFHWSLALLFAGQFVLGIVMVRTESAALQFALFQWHKSFGFSALALALLRLAWTLSNPRPDLPDGLSRLERRMARAVHMLLYLVLLVVPLTGWLVASVSPLDIPSFVFNLVVVPHLPMAKSDAAEWFWSWAHALSAYAGAALAFGHSAAALRHHFWLRDDTLRRMTRFGGAGH
jgi:cytochrome b561